MQKLGIDYGHGQEEIAKLAGESRSRIATDLLRPLDAAGRMRLAAIDGG